MTTKAEWTMNTGDMPEVRELSIEQLLNCALRIRLKTSPDEHQVHAEPFVVLAWGNQEVPWGDWITNVRMRVWKLGTTP